MCSCAHTFLTFDVYEVGFAVDLPPVGSMRTHTLNYTPSAKCIKVLVFAGLLTGMKILSSPICRRALKIKQKMQNLLKYAAVRRETWNCPKKRWPQIWVLSFRIPEIHHVRVIRSAAMKYVTFKLSVDVSFCLDLFLKTPSLPSVMLWVGLRFPSKHFML